MGPDLLAARITTTKCQLDSGAGCGDDSHKTTRLFLLLRLLLLLFLRFDYSLFLR